VVATYHAGVTERIYFRQLLSGRDFAVDDALAQQMVNFVYLIGDRASGEAVVVDPAYGVDELVEMAGHDGMRITGALATHHHPDHVGGSMAGYSIEGVARLLELADARIHVNRNEATWVQRVTGASDSDLVAHDSGDVLEIGSVPVTFLHTPGHTPGSQCFMVDGMLVSGDTLFIEGCGRTDLPGGDAEAMYESLQRLASLPDETVVYPGHRYAAPSMATIAAVRDINYVFKPKSQEQWLTMFGAS